MDVNHSRVQIFCPSFIRITRSLVHSCSGIVKNPATSEIKKTPLPNLTGCIGWRSQTTCSNEKQAKRLLGG